MVWDDWMLRLGMTVEGTVWGGKVEAIRRPQSRRAAEIA